MPWQEAASVLAYRGGWRAVRYLPDRPAYRLFDQVADLAYTRNGRGVQRLRANLARVVPDGELEAVTRAGMRSYLRYWCDVFRLPDWDADRIVPRLRADNEQYMREPLAAGTGLIGALPHMGNWDHAGAWATLTGAKVTTVAERLRPEAVYADFRAFREGLGMEILPLDGDQVDVFATLADRVRANHFVPLLADRDLTARGVPVTFFGEQASMPAGPAALALRTGAPLVPVTLWYEGSPPDHIAVLHYQAPVPVPDTDDRDEAIRSMTQSLAHAFEATIAQHPEDWHMLQRVFRADVMPDEGRRMRASP